MVVCAVDMEVGRAVGCVHDVTPACVAYALARVVPPEYDRLGAHSGGGKGRAEAPAKEKACGVGGNLYACADVADDRGGLEEGDAMASVREGVRGGEAAETAADDDDVNGKGRLSTAVERRDGVNGDGVGGGCGGNIGGVGLWFHGDKGKRMDECGVAGKMWGLIRGAITVGGLQLAAG